MNTNLTLFQRFLSETPPFWKKMQLFGAVIIAIAALLGKFPLVPASVIPVVYTIGYVVVLISSFAVKDCAIVSDVLTGKESLPDAVLDAIKSLPDQIAEVKATIAAKPAIVPVAEAVNNVVTDFAAVKWATDAQPVAQTLQPVNPEPQQPVVTPVVFPPSI